MEPSGRGEGEVKRGGAQGRRGRENQELVSYGGYMQRCDC